MASKPEVTSLSANSVDILNAIRNSATANYKDYVPTANSSVESIREIGSVIMNYEALQNEFLSALVNRIGRVLISSKMYENPWSAFKKGMLEFGETVEEIFVNIAKPFSYDVDESESTVFKRELPNVQSSFHVLNYKKFYKVTVQREQLRQAFLSWDGITDLITKIINSMYTGANYDEFQTMKYMLAKNIIAGTMYPVVIDEVSASNAKSIVSKIKATSNKFEFMSPNYNRAGVQNFVMKENQYMIVNSNFDAVMDVEVLASAFNMSKAEFSGHRVLVDSFGNLDIERLNTLFSGCDWYEEISQDEMDALNTIPAVLVDSDYFMIFDNMMNFTEQYNGQGLYWNYWYHVWKTFSVSPFANSAVFVAGDPSVTKVSVTPSTATVSKGQAVQLSADVTTKNYASKVVNWSVDDESKASVDIYGRVVIADNASGTVKVTAVSAVDGTKSAVATLTIS